MKIRRLTDEELADTKKYPRSEDRGDKVYLSAYLKTDDARAYTHKVWVPIIKNASEETRKFALARLNNKLSDLIDNPPQLPSH